MTDDSADWLRDLAVNIRADPLIPPGSLVMRSGAEQASVAIPGPLAAAEVTVDEHFAEDMRSVIESARYVIRYDESGPAIICECCGSQVAEVPESRSTDSPRRWDRGIWEWPAARRHTLRRCKWLRANP